jgi:hypothetical protein
MTGGISTAKWTKESRTNDRVGTATLLTLDTEGHGFQRLGRDGHTDVRELGGYLDGDWTMSMVTAIDTLSESSEHSLKLLCHFRFKLSLQVLLLLGSSKRSRFILSSTEWAEHR